MNIMDMESGKYIGDGFGAFEEEVLNAQWLPQQHQSELRLGVQELIPDSVTPPTMAINAEAFLRNVYLSQE